MRQRVRETRDTLMKKKTTMTCKHFLLDIMNIRFKKKNKRNRSKMGMKFCKSSMEVIGVTNMRKNK